LLSLACGLTLLAGVSGAAQAACGTTQRFSAEKDVGPGRAPLAIGDSMLLGAAEELAAIGYDVDARICRPTSEGLDVLRKRARKGKLPRFVVVALGANSTFTRDDVRAALKIIGPDRVLGLVTPREVPTMNTGDAAMMRAAARRWRKRIALIDWVKHSKRHRGLTYADGIHLTPKGQQAFAQLMKRRLKLALPPVQPEPAPDDPDPPASGDPQGGATA
jgi:lysophospholipase L1-like esterase